MAITGCELQNVTVGKGLNGPGLRQAGDMVDLDYPSFLIDREEDTVPPGPPTPQSGDPQGYDSGGRGSSASQPTGSRAQRHQWDR